MINLQSQDEHLWSLVVTDDKGTPLNLTEFRLHQGAGGGPRLVQIVALCDSLDLWARWTPGAMALAWEPLVRVWQRVADAPPPPFNPLVEDDRRVRVQGMQGRWGEVRIDTEAGGMLEWISSLDLSARADEGATYLVLHWTPPPTQDTARLRDWLQGVVEDWRKLGIALPDPVVPVPPLLVWAH